MKILAARGRHMKYVLSGHFKTFFSFSVVTGQCTGIQVGGPFPRPVVPKLGAARC